MAYLAAAKWFSGWTMFALVRTLYAYKEMKMTNALCPVCGTAGPEGLACDRARCRGAKFGMRSEMNEVATAGSSHGLTRVDMPAYRGDDSPPAWDAPRAYQEADADEEYDAIEVPPLPQRRSRGGMFAKVAVATVLLGGVGVAVGVATSGDGPAPPREARQTEPIEPREVPAATAATANDNTEESAVDEAGAKAPSDVKPESPEPIAEEAKPTWVDAVAKSNAWIRVDGAHGDITLGVAAAELRTQHARARTTGFLPHKAVLAPKQSFEMQAHEVTWGELERFVTADGRAGPKRPQWVPDAPSERAELPATGVPWSLASAFCRAMDGFLPTEAQWEWAARGTRLHTYPWGEALPHAQLVHFRRGSETPVFEVETASQDTTPDGIHDLLGNAREWTRDAWTSRRPGGVASSGQRAVRGWPLGAAGSSLPNEGATYRSYACATDDCPADELIGFRCVSPL